jgi:lipopolysaccharide biosynthesis glycosyltransferase
MSKSINHAVATILFFDITKADEKLFDNYLVLSLLLANKLKQMKAIAETKYETLVLIDKPTLSQLKKINKWHLLTKAFDRVIVSENHEAFFLKIELWNIIPDYSSIVYLDSDCFIKTEKALDLLFEESLDISEDIVACNETTWPDMFNTGVFAINNKSALSYKELVEHSKTFNELCNSKSEEVELYDNLDQGLLNYVFSNSWKNLSYVYNVQVRGDSKSNSNYSDPSETYFLFQEKGDSKTPEKTSPSETGYFTYANNALKQSKENKFLNKAMIVQFMEKPWESPVMDYVAPEYYSSFNKTKQDVCKQEEVKDTKAPETPKTPEKPKIEKKSAFEFPWIKYEDFPTANTREWR